MTAGFEVSDSRSSSSMNVIFEISETWSLNAAFERGTSLRRRERNVAAVAEEKMSLPPLENKSRFRRLKTNLASAFKKEILLSLLEEKFCR